MLYICIVFLLVSMAIVFFMWRTAFLDRLLYQELYFTDFPESFREIKIFFISDIHRRVLSEAMVKRVKGQADLVIIGGDLTEKNVPLHRVENNLKKLAEIAPVFFVWGNNDYEGDYHGLDAALLQHGVKILDNTAVHFESRHGEKMALLGIDDISENRDRLDLALQDAEQNAFRILISHNPSVIDQIKPEYSIRLILSGHTHGGQIRFLGKGLYKLGGVETKQGCLCVTSNGYGTSTLPLRLEAKPEAHLFFLKKGERTAAGKASVVKLPKKRSV